MVIVEDSKGRKYEIAVTVGAIKRARALTGVNLFDLIKYDAAGNLDLSLYDKICTDAVLLCRCAYAASNAEGAAIGEDDFLDAIGPGELPPLRLAFLREILDFFPAGRLIRKVMEYQEAAAEKAKQTIEAIDANAIEKALTLKQ